MYKKDVDSLLNRIKKNADAILNSITKPSNRRNESGVAKAHRIINDLRKCKLCQDIGCYEVPNRKPVTLEQIRELSEGSTSPMHMAAIMLELITAYLDSSGITEAPSSDNTTSYPVYAKQRMLSALWSEFKNDPSSMLDLSRYVLKRGNYTVELNIGLREMVEHLKSFLDNPPQHERKCIF